MSRNRAMKATRNPRGGLRLPPAIDRLRASLVEQPGGCLVKTTNLSKAGYGRMTVASQQVYTHRLMWEHHHGPIPDGMAVCHRCDNPPCCNPDHLFLGTLADNNRDMWTKGRGVLVPPKSRKVPLEEVPAIVARSLAGESKTSIARDYGVTRQAIGYLVRRETAR